VRGLAREDAGRTRRSPRLSVAVLLVGTLGLGATVPAGAQIPLTAPEPGEGRPAPLAQPESLTAPVLGAVGTLQGAAPPPANTNVLTPPTSPPTTARSAPAAGGGSAPNQSSGPPVGPIAPTPNSVAAAAVAAALQNQNAPSASGPIDPRLVPSSTGLAQILDDLAGKQRDLAARVRMLEASLGTGSPAIAGGTPASSLPPGGNFDLGRIDQMLAQERDLLARVDNTRSGLSQSDYPTLLQTPPTTSPPLAATGAPGTSGAITAASPATPSPGPGSLPRNPTSVVSCAPSLLRGACAEPDTATAKPVPDLVRTSAVRFLSEMNDKRTERTRQLREVQQELEAAHLRAVTNVPTAGTVAGAATPSTAAAPTTPAGLLAAARQELADVTSRLNAVAKANALASSGPQGAQPSRLARGDIPPDYLVLYQRAAGTCPGLSWTVLAAIGSIESSHGRSTLPGVRTGANYAGAMGPMQFLAPSWAAYGVDGDGDGFADVYRAPDAIFGAARYLCHNGGGDPANLRNAIWSYNHADWYVNRVLDLAIRYGSSGIDVLAVPARAADLVRNPNITMSPEARADFLAGIVDQRVVNLLAATAVQYRLVVTVVKTGHSQFVKGTNRVSNHFYARAVDISAVNSVDVSATNYAALDLALSILTSASSLRPSELGSPWLELSAFSGAFTDGDHADHLHIGFSS
jgi:hypothetical protein